MAKRWVVGGVFNMQCSSGHRQFVVATALSCLEALKYSTFLYKWLHTKYVLGVLFKTWLKRTIYTLLGQL